jgi:hypothetical protein
MVPASAAIKAAWAGVPAKASRSARVLMGLEGDAIAVFLMWYH